MALDIVGILQAVQFTAERPTVIDAVAREIFVNETPLWARLPVEPVRDTKYTITTYDVRQRAYAVGTGGMADGSTTSLPIADASPFMAGDVLEIVTSGTAERVEVTADPNTSATPNTLTVKRGVEGTTGAAHSAADVVTLIGNSRTGAEIDQSGSRPVRSTLTQYLQTFEFPVQVGGLAEAVSGNTPLPNGATSVFGQNRAVKLREAIRDIEYTSYFGIGQQATAAGDRQKQKGLKTLIASYNGGANVKASAGASYTRLGFIADTVQRIYDAGGVPDVCVCSTDFLTGLDTWAPNKTAYSGRETTDLGFPIKEIVLPLNADPITFIPSLQMPKGSAFVLSSGDVRMKAIRPLQWVPRANRGDAVEGEWIGDYAIHLDHVQFHAFVGGISSYA